MVRRCSLGFSLIPRAAMVLLQCIESFASSLPPHRRVLGAAFIQPMAVLVAAMADSIEEVTVGSAAIRLLPSG